MTEEDGGSDEGNDHEHASDGSSDDESARPAPSDDEGGNPPEGFTEAAGIAFFDITEALVVELEELSRDFARKHPSEDVQEQHVQQAADALRFRKGKGEWVAKVAGVFLGLGAGQLITQMQATDPSRNLVGLAVAMFVVGVGGFAYDLGKNH